MTGRITMIILSLYFIYLISNFVQHTFARITMTLGG